MMLDLTPSVGDCFRLTIGRNVIIKCEHAFQLRVTCACTVESNEQSEDGTRDILALTKSLHNEIS